MKNIETIQGSKWFPSSPKFPRKKDIGNETPVNPKVSTGKGNDSQQSATPTSKSPKFKISPPIFSFSGLTFGSNTNSSKQANTTPPIAQSVDMKSGFSAIGAGKSEPSSPRLLRLSTAAMHRKSSFTPMVDLNYLLNSLRGDTYFNYNCESKKGGAPTSKPSLTDLDEEGSVHSTSSGVGDLATRGTDSSERAKKLSSSSINSLGGGGGFTGGLRKVAASLSIPLPNSGIQSVTSSGAANSSTSWSNLLMPPANKLSSPPVGPSYQGIDLATPTNEGDVKEPDTPSGRVLTDFNAIIASGDVQQAKAFVRNNNWPIDQPIRTVMWYKLCQKIGGKGFSMPYTYDELLDEYYPALKKAKKGLGGASSLTTSSIPCEEEFYVMPIFVDEKFMSHYYLNAEGQLSLKRVVSILEYCNIDISYGPQIYYLSAILLHFLSEPQTFECMSHLLTNNGHSGETFVFKTRIGYIASGMVLMELAKKHASSSYEYLADKVKKCLDNGIGLVTPSVNLQLQKCSSNISKDDKEFQCIMEGVFAHWLHWIFRDLPFEYLVRIMDCYLLQGTKVLYRVALAILMLFKKEGKRFQDGAFPPDFSTRQGRRATSPVLSPLAQSPSAFNTLNAGCTPGAKQDNSQSSFNNIDNQKNNNVPRPSTITLSSPPSSSLTAKGNTTTGVQSTVTTPPNSGQFHQSASTATLTQHDVEPDGSPRRTVPEGLRDPRVVRFASSPQETLQQTTFEYNAPLNDDESPLSQTSVPPMDDETKRVHSQRHARHSKYSTKKISEGAGSVGGGSGPSFDGSAHRSSRDAANISKAQRINATASGMDDLDARFELDTNFDDERNSLITSATDNTANWTAIMEGRYNQKSASRPGSDDVMSSTNLSHLENINRDDLDSSVDSSLGIPKYNRNRRSTISPLAGYYEYPNIGIFVARFCQCTDFSPTKLLRIAFGIRGLRSHTIDEMTAKYERFAKERVSNLFLAAAHQEDSSADSYNEKEDAISRASINIPAPPSCGSEILDREQFRYIWNWIPFRYSMYVPQLLFTTLKDGISLRTFFNRVDGEEPTLLLIKTSRNEIFGAYLSTDWKSRSSTTAQGFFGTGESFVFTMSPTIKMYEWAGKSISTSSNTSYNTNSNVSPSKSTKSQSYPRGLNMFQSAGPNTLLIGGGSGHAIEFYNALEKGSTHACDTFASPALAADENFDVKVLEAIAFK